MPAPVVAAGVGAALVAGRFLLVRVARPAVWWLWNSKTGRKIINVTIGDIPPLTRGEFDLHAWGVTGFSVAFWGIYEDLGKEGRDYLATQAVIVGPQTDFYSKLVSTLVGTPNWSYVRWVRGDETNNLVATSGSGRLLVGVMGESGQVMALFQPMNLIDP